MKKIFQVLFRSPGRKALWASFSLAMLGSSLLYSFDQHNKSGKPMDKAARIKELTDLQRRVTQEEGTEPPFKNEYWDEKT
jgi:hypothetical protein